MTALLENFDYQFKFTSLATEIKSGHCTLSTDEILGLGLLQQVYEVTFKNAPVTINPRIKQLLLYSEKISSVIRKLTVLVE